MLPPLGAEVPTLGDQIADWIEVFLCHGPGDVEGEPFEIDAEIANFIAWVYRVHPADHPDAGRRLVQRAILSRPKGRAKSEIAGALVCAEALGPVRFDHWAEEGEVSSWGYEYVAGEPVGRSVKSPFIRCLATEEDQSGNTYDNVVVMLTQGEAGEHFGLRMGREVGLTRVLLPDGGEIAPSTAASASKDGGKETFAVADETHLYVSDQLRKMYRTVARNTGKRKDGEPWMLDTTTAWQPGERSIAEQAAEKYSHLDAEEAVEKSGVLYDHRQGDEPKRFGDDRSLIKAMRSGYGPAAEWMDFKRIVRIVRDAEDPEAEAYRYWLNRPRAAASHWLAPDEIEPVISPELVLEPKQMVCGGFDGSDSDDHTTLWICTEDGHLVPVGIWARPLDWPKDQRWEVPRDEVTAAVDWMYETFTVIRFYGDPPWFQTEMGEWAGRHGDSVREWWTNRDTPMAVACGALRTAIRNVAVTIDPIPLRTDPQVRSGKPLAVWHFENARTRKVRIKLEDKAEEAHVVRKERPGSPLKIDSVPACVLALKARDDAVKEGEFELEPAPERAVW